MAARTLALLACVAVTSLLTVLLYGSRREAKVAASEAASTTTSSPTPAAAAPPDPTNPPTQSIDGTLEVLVNVIDSLSGKPVPECTLTCRTAQSGQGPARDSDERSAVQQGNGKFAIRLTPPCELIVHGEAPDYVIGYGEGSAKFSIPANLTTRHFELKLKRGVTCRGRVVDKVTGNAIANAVVSAMVFTPPLITSSGQRRCVTDLQGQFELRGVSGLGIAVEHEDYLERSHISVGDEAERFRAEAVGSPPGVKTLVVELQKGEAIRGIIRDDIGRPVQNVSVSDGAGKQALSDETGRFELRSPRKWASGGRQYYLSLECAGFVDQQLYIDSAPLDSLQIVLPRIPHVRGRVVTDDGTPIQKFRVVAGPGESPADFETESRECDNPKGEFDLAVKQEARNWIGVRAPGFAPWEGWFDPTTNSDLVVQLQPGVAVEGRVIRPDEVKGEVRVKLVPRRPDAHEFIVSRNPARDLATETAVADPDGSFRLQHVRPDGYYFYVNGQGVTPTVQSTVVPASGLRIAEVQLRSAGRITGRVFDRQSGTPVPFANGEWSYLLGEETVVGTFKADVSGEFAIDQVPAGTISVRIPFSVTPDIVSAHVREVVVLPRQTTRAAFFEPSKSDVTVTFEVGDGSKAAFDRAAGFASKRIVDNVTDRHPLFHLSLSPLSNAGSSNPTADWEFLGDKFPYRAVLPDISAGQYQLRVGDWVGGRYSISELTTVDFEKTTGADQVHVALGSGCVTGRIATREGLGRSVRIFAVSEDGKSRRTAYGDEKADFCLRYLPVGKWTIVAWSQEAGWNQLPMLDVDSVPRDLAELSLQPGGRIEGIISFDVEGVPPLTLVARHETGVALETPLKQERHGFKYTISSLWPGEWTIILRSRNQEIARSSTRIRETETKTVDIRRDQKLE